MDAKQWLTGWKAIGKHIGKSAKTAQRYARKGMPFFRDPGGRPVALPWQLNEWLVERTTRRRMKENLKNG